MSITAPLILAAPQSDPAVPDVPIHRLTVDQYQVMAEAGILSEDDPVELLEGWLVETTIKKPPQMVATGLLLDLFPRLLPAGWFLNLQDPIATPDSMPEPDAVIIRGARRDYSERQPAAADIAPVVEVVDTSLRQDRGLKRRIYARAGIPIYWIVNLVDRQIEVYTEPTGLVAKPTYHQRRDYRSADTVPVVLDKVQVAFLQVQDLLP